MVSASATLAMKLEIKKLVKEYTELKDLVKSMLQKVEMLESVLINEKTAKAQYQQDLKLAQEELKRVQQQQKLDNERCLEAMSIMEGFKRKYKDAQGKIKELEKDLVAAKAVVTMAEHERVNSYLSS